MSDSEKFEIQGKTYAALKQARGNAATCKAALLTYRDSLNEVAALVSQFIGDPEAKNRMGVSLSSHLKSSIENLREAAVIVRLADELSQEMVRVRELEEQVSRF